MDWKSIYFKDRNHQTISTTSSRCLQYENQTDEDGRNKVTKQTHCCVEVFLENKTNIFDYNIEHCSFQNFNGIECSLPIIHTK